jgi:arylsulfatase A-like enzyme
VKLILLLTGLICLSHVSPPLWAQTIKPSKEKPNILRILVDDLGFADLSGYGAKDLQTPNIDGLIEAGMKFTNFYANSPVCSPTRVPILTGRYPDMAGLPGVIRTNTNDSWGYLSPKEGLLPLLLKQSGYYTSLIGKWHLGLESPNTPNQHGFNHIHGFLGDIMDDYYIHQRDGKNFMRLNNQVIKPESHATDLFSQCAIYYLDNRKSKKEPFFMYLAYNVTRVTVQQSEAA